MKVLFRFLFFVSPVSTHKPKDIVSPFYYTHAVLKGLPAITEKMKPHTHTHIRGNGAILRGNQCLEFRQFATPVLLHFWPFYIAVWWLWTRRGAGSAAVLAKMEEDYPHCPLPLSPVLVSPFYCPPFHSGNWANFLVWICCYLSDYAYPNRIKTGRISPGFAAFGLDCDIFCSFLRFPRCSRMCKKGKQYDNVRTLSTLYTQKPFRDTISKRCSITCLQTFCGLRPFTEEKTACQSKSQPTTKESSFLNWEPSSRDDCLPNLDTCLALAKGNSGVCLTVWFSLSICDALSHSGYRPPRSFCALVWREGKGGGGDSGVAAPWGKSKEWLTSRLRMKLYNLTIPKNFYNKSVFK